MPLPFPPDSQMFESVQRPFVRGEYWPTTFTPLRNELASAGIRMWMREPMPDGTFGLGAGSAFQLASPAGVEDEFDNATAKTVVSDGRVASLIAYWGGGAPGYHGATKTRRVAYHFKAVVRPTSGRDWFTESGSFFACVSCHGNGYFRVIHTPLSTGVPFELVDTDLDERSFVDRHVGPFFSDSASFTTGDTVDFYYVQDLTDWGGYYFKLVPGGKPGLGLQDIQAVRARRLALREAPIICCGLMDDGESASPAMAKRTFSMIKGAEVSRQDGQTTRAAFRVPLANTAEWDGVGWEWVRGLGSILPPPVEGAGPYDIGTWATQSLHHGITWTVEPGSGFNGGPAFKLALPASSGTGNTQVTPLLYLPILSLTNGHQYRITAKIRTSWNVATANAATGNPGLSMHWLIPPGAGVGHTTVTSAAFGNWETVTHNEFPIGGQLAPILSLSNGDGAYQTGPLFAWFSDIKFTDVTASTTITLPITFGGGGSGAGSATAQSTPDQAGFLRLHDFVPSGGGVAKVTLDLKRQHMIRLVGGFRRWDNTEEQYALFTGFIDDFEGAGGGEVTVHCLGVEQRLADQFVKNYPDVISYMAGGFSKLSGTVEPVFPIPAYDNWPQEVAIRDMLVRCGIDESRTRAPLLVPQPDGSAIEVEM